MIARRAIGVVFLALALIGGQSFALAQDVSAESSAAFSVLDARTRLPIAHARVLIDGAQVRVGFTDVNGTVRFEHVQAGDYEARIALRGYDTKTVPFAVPQGHGDTAVITLTATRDLRPIGTVRARPIASVDGPPAAATGLGGTFAGGTGLETAQVPFETVLGGAALGRLTLDGAPLAPAGIPTDLRGIDSTLLTSVRQSGAPSVDGSTGTIALGSLNPTIAWQQRIAGGADSAGSSRYAATVQGTTGETGLAFAASTRHVAGPFDGATFADGTGSALTHAQAADRASAVLKARAALGAQNLTATVATSSARDDVVCDVFTGTVPCGYGPGLRNSVHSSSVVLNDVWKPGKATLNASVFRSATSLVDDESSFRVAGVRAPFTRSTRYTVSGAAISASFRSNERLTFGGSGAYERDSYASEQRSTVFDENVPSSFAHAVRANLDASYVLSRAATLSGVVGVERLGGSNSRSLTQLRADVQATRNDTVALSTSMTAGSGVAFNANSAQLTDPYHLAFDCTSGVARGRASGDAPGDGSVVDTRLTAHHRIVAGDLAMSLYRTRANGATIDVALPYSAIADSLPFGYFEAATSGYATVGGCGSRVPLTADGIVLDVPISGFREIVEGATFAAAVRLHNLTVYAFDRVAVAKAYGSDPRIVAGSTFIPGSQLPGIPLHRAGLTLDYRAGSATELLLDTRYVSANGPANLPAYVSVGAGIARTLPHGTLTVAVSNLFDAASGDFARPGGVPIPTRSGPMLATIARPLAPRRIELAYTIRGGAASENATVRPGDDADVFETITITHPALTGASPADALAAHTTSERCDIRAFRRTRELLHEVADLSEQVNAHRGPAGYPDSLTLNPAGDLHATYHQTPTSYALVIELPSERDYEAVSACADVRAGNAENATGLHLFVPDQPLAPRQDVIYSPAGGLYVVPSVSRSPMAFQDLPLPVGPPPDPFIVRADCPSELRSEASALLEELRAYVGGTRRLTQWAATPTSSGFAFAVLDTAKEQAVGRCGAVATASPQDAGSRGLALVRAPRIGFAPAYGLYVVRP